MRDHWQIVRACSLVAACSSPSNSFSGASQSCGNGETEALLLTPSLQNGTPGNYLEYQISVTCQGSLLPLSANRLLFDYSGSDSENLPTLPYKLTSPGAAPASGSLDTIVGSDLFGNRGDFQHYASNQVIALPSGTTTATLHIDLLGDRIVVYAHDTSPVASSELATYLAFGTAKPVTKNVVLQGR